MRKSGKRVIKKSIVMAGKSIGGTEEGIKEIKILSQTIIIQHDIGKYLMFVKTTLM